MSERTDPEGLPPIPEPDDRREPAKLDRPRSLLQRWRQRPRTKAMETLETVVLAGGIAWFVHAFIAASFYIPSESMLPGLEINDRLLAEKLSYRFHPPRRGDIVVFDPPPKATALAGNAVIKRVVGLPGETIAIHSGLVFIDGQPLTEPYTLAMPAYPEPDWHALGMAGGRIPSDAVFVMGDNRNNSADSHVWGTLPIDHIIGHAVFRFWPIPRIGPVS